MTLYILGNGFDLAHGLKTRYLDYKAYIKSRIKNHSKWQVILDYYPENFDFWSDVETNVCKINPVLFTQNKKIWDSAFLDDLLFQIHDSFEWFIINVEKEVLNLEPKFTFDDDAMFYTFNYTTTLRDVYKISGNRMVYIHNDIGGSILDKTFSIENNEHCVIGHSPVPDGFFFYTIPIIGSDKEYIDFRNKTTKHCESIIKKKKIREFLLTNRNNISEVRFYGFSFSPADKLYLQTFYLFLPPDEIRYKVYYYVGSGETEEMVVKNLQKRIMATGTNPYEFEYINCEGLTKI